MPLLYTSLTPLLISTTHPASLHWSPILLLNDWYPIVLSPHCSLVALDTTWLWHHRVGTSDWPSVSIELIGWFRGDDDVAGHREVRAPLVMLGNDSCVPYMMILNSIICPSQWGFYSFNTLNSSQSGRGAAPWGQKIPVTHLYMFCFQSRVHSGGC